MFSAYSRRSVTLRGVVKYQPGNAPRVLALELTSLFRALASSLTSLVLLLARLYACMEADWLRESFFHLTR